MEARSVPLVVRDDGFSQFYYTEPPMTREILEDKCIDYLIGTHVKVKEWGLGPGSVFTYDTKVGEIVGENLDEEQKRLIRVQDQWVHDNVKGLIDAGHDPIEIVVKRCHELDIKVWARLEMNHEYGPASMDNWLWVLAVGEFNKQHPEYRIPNTVHLDFKHQEVRDFKLAIFREVAEKGVDGISMDFAVYPPFLSDPEQDSGILSTFVRDVRSMLDEVGERQNRKIELIARVAYDAVICGLNWKEWIQEGLLDVIIPSIVVHDHKFDVPIDEFITAAAGTSCKVYGCIRPYIGSLDTDEQPGDEEKGILRYERPVTESMFYAKASLLLRAGVDGIQIALGSGMKWEPQHQDRVGTNLVSDAWQPFFNELGSAKLLKFKSKHYIINRLGQLPAEFSVVNPQHRIKVRIADDLQEAADLGIAVDSKLILFSGSLEEKESLTIHVNGKGPLILTRSDLQNKGDSLDPDLIADKTFYYERDWWKRGMNELSVPSSWFQTGSNSIDIRYDAAAHRTFKITNMDVMIEYHN